VHQEGEREDVAIGALPASATELGRLSDRLSFLYVEHAIVDRESNAVTIWRADGIANVPAAMLACLLLGPGTRVTQAAVSLLAGSGCSVAWTGEEGVRMYAGAVTASTSSGLLQRQAALVSGQRSRLAVARAMYGMRFPGEELSGLTMQQLRGREGARVRAAYREHARQAGVSWDGRKYDPSDWAGSDPVNQCLSAANSALYGICHAAVLHLGCSPGLGFVHTGHQLSFVYDIADLYKAQITIPAAFSVAAVGGGDLGGRVRRAVRDAIKAQRLLPRVAADIRRLLGAPAEDPEDDGPALARLWDGAGTVPGGTGYGDGP
jgi:CRISPR-associated protein Cas1